MDHVSSTSSSTTPIRHIEPDPDLTTLPTDVMPNIFNRLSSDTDFFRLACTSKAVHCLVQPCLRDLATGKLAAFDPQNLEASIYRLAPLFRTGSHLVSDEAWLDLLKKTGEAGIDRESIETLLFSFTADDAKLPALPKYQRNAADGYPVMYPLEQDHSARNRIAAMQTICTEGVVEMTRAERCNTYSEAKTRQLSLRPGWKGLTEIFRQFDIPNQIKFLASVWEYRSDGENILLAFEELVAAHLAVLLAADNFIFPPEEFRHEEIDRYYNVLADVCTLKPALDKDSFLVSLCKKSSFSWFPGFLPWRQNWRGPCNLMFRLIAIEARKDKPADMEAWSNPVTDKALKMFITRKDLNHFVKKLNARMDQGMPLEQGVSKWIDENQEPGKCVIS